MLKYWPHPAHIEVVDTAENIKRNCGIHSKTITKEVTHLIATKEDVEKDAPKGDLVPLKLLHRRLSNAPETTC